MSSIFRLEISGVGASLSELGSGRKLRLLLHLLALQAQLVAAIEALRFNLELLIAIHIVFHYQIDDSMTRRTY